MRKFLIACMVLLTVVTARGATYYWDSATNAGLQSGSGDWGMDVPSSVWSISASGNIPLVTWTNNQPANFSSQDGTASVIYVQGVVTNYNAVDGSFVVDGSLYDIRVTNNMLIGESTSIRVYIGGNVAGVGTAATNNSLTVDGGTVTNLRWLVIGNKGGTGNNALMVTNGGKASFSSSVTLGTATHGNQVIVIGSNATDKAFLNAGSGGIVVGGASSNNLLLVGRGGQVVAGVLSFGGTNNFITITNGGVLLSSAAAATTLGSSSPNNIMSVVGSESIWVNNNSTFTLGVNAAGTNNLLYIDGQGVEGGAVVTNVGALAFGQSANDNNIVITNGGKFFSSGAANIGQGGSRNTMIVVGGAATSLWSAGAGAISIGTSSGFADNRLLVLSGGVVTSAASIAVGSSLITTNSTLLIDGGIVRSTALISTAGRSASLTVTNGGTLVTAGTSMIGSSAVSNTVIVSGSSVWDNSHNNLVVGFGATSVGNKLQIIGGGSVTNVGGLTISGIQNEMVVDNSTYNMPTGPVGFSGSRGCLLLFTNGAKAQLNRVMMGSAGSHKSNTLWQTGIGTVVNYGQSTVTVGSLTSPYNKFIVDSGAVATNIQLLNFSLTTASSYNEVIVTNGGKLFVKGGIIVQGEASTVYDTTTCSGTNSYIEALSVTLGANTQPMWSNNLYVVDGGTVQVINQLQLSSTNNTTINGGTLSVSNLLVDNVNASVSLPKGSLSIVGGTYQATNALVVGDGVQAALLAIRNGSFAVWNGLTVSPNSTLSGRGTIVASNNVQGILRIGVPTVDNSVGVLTNRGAVVFQSTAQYQVDINTNTTAGAGWDYVVVTNGAVTLGGTLKAVMSTSYRPSSSDSFLVMTNQGDNITGSLTGGTLVNVYDSTDGTVPIGTMTAIIGARDVRLSGFTSGGTGTLKVPELSILDEDNVFWPMN